MRRKTIVFKGQSLKKVILLSIGITFLLINNSTAQMKDNFNDSSAKNQSIKVLELRNYLMKPGKRDSFITFFEDNFIKSQNALGGYVLGQYRVKDGENNFFWIRGFKTMQARSKYLPEFYHSEFWKARRNTANDLINNNDNVYLMRALNLSSETADMAFSSNEIGSKKGLTVLDFYVANGRLDEMISFFRKVYIPFLIGLGISDFTTWEGETEVNDFPGLPVFQDGNLIITISHFTDEKEYLEKMKLLNSIDNQKMKIAFHDIVTTKTTIILYPTDKSFY